MGERSFGSGGRSSSLLLSSFTPSASRDTLDTIGASSQHYKYLEAVKHRLTIGSDRQ
jgi:hypothetical protein